MGPITFVGVVLGAESLEETEGNGVGGTGAVVAGAGGGDSSTEGVGA